MPYVQIVQVQIEGAPAPFEARIRFDLPGVHSDAEVLTLARHIVAGYRDTYSARVRQSGLYEVDRVREIAAPGSVLQPPA